MTKQEILKEIESILDSFETQESECLISFSIEKLLNKSKIKKKFSLNRKNQSEPNVDRESAIELNKAIYKAIEKCAEEQSKGQIPYPHPCPYFIPNNSMQPPWYWDKVICSGSGTAVSISEDPLSAKVTSNNTSVVKGYYYP